MRRLLAIFATTLLFTLAPTPASAIVNGQVDEDDDFPFEGCSPSTTPTVIICIGAPGPSSRRRWS